MDEWDIQTSEKIFSIVKDKKILPDVILKQTVLPKEDRNDAQKIRAYDRVIEILSQHDIIRKVLNKTGYGNSYAIHEGPNSFLFNSVGQYFQDREKQKQKDEQQAIVEAKKRELEIRYLEVQIWANEKWYLIAAGSALIGVAATKLIETILTK